MKQVTESAKLASREAYVTDIKRLIDETLLEENVEKAHPVTDAEAVFIGKFMSKEIERGTIPIDAEITSSAMAIVNCITKDYSKVPPAKVLYARRLLRRFYELMVNFSADAAFEAKNRIISIN